MTPPKPIRLRLERLRYADLRSRAEAFLRDCGRAEELPVDVDAIAEFDLGLDIVPVQDFHVFDGVSCVSRDCTTIYVDQEVMRYWEPRYRFSLAHEIAHVVLHKDILATLDFSSPEEWVALCLSIDEEDYGWLEFQACSFAGCLLVPGGHLDREFRAEVKGRHDRFARARERGLDREDYLEHAVDTIIGRLRPVFLCSSAVLEKRIAKDRLADLIP